MYIFKCLRLYCTLIEGCVALGASQLIANAVLPKQNKAKFIRTKAKSLMMLNLTTIHHLYR